MLTATPAIRNIWPRSCPEEPRRASYIIKSYMQTIIDSPLGLHASISAQIHNIPLSSFRNSPQGPQKLALARLKHQNEAFRLINAEIKTLERVPNTVPTNGILSAVAILSLYGMAQTTELRQAHPLSPLATAQNLHIYGRMNLVPEHIKGLHMLVKQRGGVASVDNHSLVDLIKSVDVNYASRSLTRPGLTWPDPVEVVDFLAKRSYRPDATSRALEASLGMSFALLPALPSDVSRALEVVCKVIAGLDHYHRRAPDAPGLAVLVQSRNSALHKLLSLAEYGDPSCYAERVHEICRLAALIFSDMVLLPFPPESLVKPRLAKKLLGQLQALPEDIWSMESSYVASGFLSWAMILGGIAAFSTEMRDAFVELMRKRGILTKHGTWEEVNGSLGTFLWWDFVCREAGRTLWDEAVGFDAAVALVQAEQPKAVADKTQGT
jgi:Fungal specific transcription factor domain